MLLRLDKIEAPRWKGFEQLVSFRVNHGHPFNIRLSPNGRLVSVVHGNRTLHSRAQKGPGGRRFRLPSATVRRCHEIACAAVAFVALGRSVEDFPVQELDL